MIPEDKARMSVTRYLLTDSPLPTNLKEAIRWMQERLESVPAAARLTASIEFYPNVAITYAEPETDAEVTERLEVDAERKRIKELEELRQLEALQQKYATG